MVQKKSQPERSSNAGKKPKQPVIDQTIKSQLATFKAELEGIRIYFLFEADPDTISASDIMSRGKKLRDFIATVDGWEKRGIVELLFNNIETVKMEIKNAKKHFHRASGLLPPPGTKSDKQWEKRPPEESDTLSEAYDGISDALQMIINEFVEFK